MISKSSRISKNEVDADGRERNPDTSSRKEERLTRVPQETVFILSHSFPSEENQVKRFKIAAMNDDKSPTISRDLTGLQLDSANHPFKTSKSTDFNRRDEECTKRTHSTTNIDAHLSGLCCVMLNVLMEPRHSWDAK